MTFNATKEDRALAILESRAKNRAVTKKKWRETNKDKWADYHRKWRENNPDKWLGGVREWRKHNKEVAANYVHTRRRGLRSRPPWQKQYTKAFAQLRKEARKLTNKHNEQYVLDHIIPIKHTKVCGLHVPWNIQVIPKLENDRKRNMWDGTYENKRWWNGST